jgi:hypothetical protein
MKNVIIHLNEDSNGTGKVSAVCINHPTEPHEYLIALVPVEPVNKELAWVSGKKGLPAIKMHGEEFNFSTRYRETNGPEWNGHDMSAEEACKFLNALKRSGEWVFADGTDWFKDAWDSTTELFVTDDFFHLQIPTTA